MLHLKQVSLPYGTPAISDNMLEALQAKFGSPICWVEMDLSEVSKAKAEGSKSSAYKVNLLEKSVPDKTYGLCWKISFMSINPIQVKFMWRMSSWV